MSPSLDDTFCPLIQLFCLTHLNHNRDYICINRYLESCGNIGDTMLIGYARTSTVDQAAGFEAQIVELEAYGCERTYQEQVSAVASRHELETAIDMYVRVTSWLLLNWTVLPATSCTWVSYYNK